MNSAIRYDSSTNVVVEFLAEVSNPDAYLPAQNWAVFTTLPAGFPGTRLDFWKVEAGALVERNQAEKDALLAQAAAATVNDEKGDAKALFDDTNMGRLLRAMVEETVNALNVVRTNPTAVLPEITPAQVRTAIRNNIDGQT